MERISLKIIQLDMPVADHLVYGLPMWPQWEIYSPYDLFPAKLDVEALSFHLVHPSQHVSKKQTDFEVDRTENETVSLEPNHSSVTLN